MSEEFFLEQIARLRGRFGDRSFDPEFTRMLAIEVAMMQEHEFAQIVDTMIGYRSHTRPPLLVDFREARLQIEKRKFNHEVNRTSERVSTQPISSILRRDYPGCKTVAEAIEVERRRQRATKPNGDKKE